MNAAPTLSVLLPVRDAAPWLPETLADLLAQQGPSFEILAVDDGSCDGSREILDRAARDDSRIRVFDGLARGPAHALNLALSEARAPWVGHMEADDRCPADRWQILLAALQDHGWDGVLSQVEQCGEVSPGMDRYLAWQNSLLRQEEMGRLRFVEIPAMHQTGLYRAEMLRDLGGYREHSEWPLDIDFWMRWLATGASFGKVPRVLYSWRQHARQSTRTSPRHTLAALRRCKCHYLLAGPARDRKIELFSRGQTLTDWQDELLAQGATVARSVSWKPGEPFPEPATTSVGDESIRLFVFGMERARRRVRESVPDFDVSRDWFAA